MAIRLRHYRVSVSPIVPMQRVYVAVAITFDGGGSPPPNGDKALVIINDPHLAHCRIQICVRRTTMTTED